MVKPLWLLCFGTGHLKSVVKTDSHQVGYAGATCGQKYQCFLRKSRETSVPYYRSVTNGHTVEKGQSKCFRWTSAHLYQTDNITYIHSFDKIVQTVHKMNQLKLHEIFEKSYFKVSIVISQHFRQQLKPSLAVILCSNSAFHLRPFHHVILLNKFYCCHRASTERCSKNWKQWSQQLRYLKWLYTVQSLYPLHLWQVDKEWLNMMHDINNNT